MTIQVDLAVLELVCSRLCHDLVGPVGAATNGLELLRELNDTGQQAIDVLDITDDSSRTAWRRLEFFRVAFGYSGGRTAWSGSELKALAAGMLKNTKVALDWPDSGNNPPIQGRGGKLVLNLVFLIAEALPRGGEVRVTLDPTPAAVRLCVEGAGQGAALHPRVLSMVTGEWAHGDLDSRVILAHLACLQARSAGADIDWSFGQDQLAASFLLPLPQIAAPAP